MSFITLKEPQNVFLEKYLRGTGRTITAADARARFGISNLRARMTELRQAGLRVNVDTSSTGTARYSISARDAAGSRARAFS